MIQTTTPTQVVFDAWIQCEQVLEELSALQSGLTKKLSQILDECALICMGTFNALKTQSANARPLSLLCVGICEECAELCEASKQDCLKECAKTCRSCSEAMSILAFTAI